ncbi:MAG: hypothetical protein ACRCZ9_12335 [Fusobacteriaceae bacterium]
MNSLQKEITYFKNKIMPYIDLDTLNDDVHSLHLLKRVTLNQLMSANTKMQALLYEQEHDILIPSVSVYIDLLEDIHIIPNIFQDYKYNTVHSPMVSAIIDANTIDNIHTYIIMCAHRNFSKPNN